MGNIRQTFQACQKKLDLIEIYYGGYHVGVTYLCCATLIVTPKFYS